MILAIDTSTDEAGVAILSGEKIEAELIWQARGNHSRELPGAIEQVLRLAGVALANTQLVAVAIGPGSFSGIRVGISLAKGLALGLDIPLAGIPTLDVLGYQGSGLAPNVWALLPAGRDQFYAARYVGRDSTWRQVGNYAVMDKHAIAAAYQPGELLIGTGTEEVARHLRDQEIEPRAAPPPWRVRRPAFLGALVQREIERGVREWPEVEPLYLRPSAAEEKRFGGTSP